MGLTIFVPFKENVKQTYIDAASSIIT